MNGTPINYRTSYIALAHHHINNDLPLRRSTCLLHVASPFHSAFIRFRNSQNVEPQIAQIRHSCSPENTRVYGMAIVSNGFGIRDRRNRVASGSR